MSIKEIATAAKEEPAAACGQDTRSVVKIYWGVTTRNIKKHEID